MKISVIICTHNPRPDYLQRTLDALQKQSLPKSDWELILIDNASNEPISSRWDLSWHPKSRIVQEKRLGLTSARLKGISESSAGLLVFIDDDNIIEKTYLKKAVNIAKSKKKWGVWSGSSKGKYQKIIDPFWKKYEEYICVKKIIKEQVSESLFDWNAMPHGAGMVVRRQVANLYARLCKKDIKRRKMDRTGSKLISGGDNDIALCAYKAGFYYAVTPKMSLNHLIPASRVHPGYLLKIIRGSSFSNLLLQEIHSAQKIKISLIRNAIKLLKGVIRSDPREFLVHLYQFWGEVQYAFKKI